MNVKYWRMSCVGVNGDLFGLLWNLNEIGNFNKLYVDFWCYLVLSWWMIICFWIDIVVKITLIKTFYLRLAKYILRQFLLIFKCLEDNFAINFDFPTFLPLQHLIFEIMTYIWGAFSIWNESIPFHKNNNKKYFF
jgi:hypothetical protein